MTGQPQEPTDLPITGEAHTSEHGRIRIYGGGFVEIDDDGNVSVAGHKLTKTELSRGWYAS